MTEEFDYSGPPPEIPKVEEPIVYCPQCEKMMGDKVFMWAALLQYMGLWMLGGIWYRDLHKIPEAQDLENAGAIQSDQDVLNIFAEHGLFPDQKEECEKLYKTIEEVWKKYWEKK